MTTTIISNGMPYTFGQLTNQAVSRLISLNANLARLQEAIATASSGFDGTDGTQFEAPPMGANLTTPNLFGVQANPDTPGEQGVAYRYAMDSLTAAWRDFWTTAAPFIEQLDNGTYSM